MSEGMSSGDAETQRDCAELAHSIHIELSDDEARHIAQIAKERDLSHSAVVMNALRVYRGIHFGEHKLVSATKAPAPQWQLTPPGAGLWWHTKSKAEFARPYELNVTRDGVLRSGAVTDNWGTFVRADSLGGYWWPVPLTTPAAEVPGIPAEAQRRGN